MCMCASICLTFMILLEDENLAPYLIKNLSNNILMDIKKKKNLKSINKPNLNKILQPICDMFL